MPAIVSKVLENSIAEELEIQAGDEILTIDDTKMQDMIDYNYLCKSEVITLEIKKVNGEIEVIELEKDFDEDLGIVFESPKDCEKLFMLKMMTTDFHICREHTLH